MIILFKAAITKRKREEALGAFIETLASRLPIASLYSEVYPTSAMKAAVASVYTEVMRFLDAALVYYRSGRLGKLVDAVIQPVEVKLNPYADAIEAAVRNIESLKDAALAAQINDIKDNLQDTGRGNST